MLIKQFFFSFKLLFKVKCLWSILLYLTFYLLLLKEMKCLFFIICCFFLKLSYYLLVLLGIFYCILIFFLFCYVLFEQRVFKNNISTLIRNKFAYTPLFSYSTCEISSNISRSYKMPILRPFFHFILKSVSLTWRNKTPLIFHTTIEIFFYLLFYLR